MPVGTKSLSERVLPVQEHDANKDTPQANPDEIYEAADQLEDEGKGHGSASFQGASWLVK